MTPRGRPRLNPAEEGPPFPKLRKKAKRPRTGPRKPSKRATDPTIDPDGLRLWRVTKNLTNPIWSQEYTARWLGVSCRQYRRWENGVFPVPLYVSNRINEYESLLYDIAVLRREIQRLTPDT